MNLSHIITEFSFGPHFPDIVQPLDNSFEATDKSQFVICKKKHHESITNSSLRFHCVPVFLACRANHLHCPSNEPFKDKSIQCYSLHTRSTARPRDSRNFLQIRTRSSPYYATSTNNELPSTSHPSSRRSWRRLRMYGLCYSHHYACC